MKPPRLLPRHYAASLPSSRASTPYICQNCLSSLPTSRQQAPSFINLPIHRLYSSSSSTQSKYAPLPTRRLLSLSGPDSTKFLQGSITANISSSRTSGFYAAFLNAQGRVLNDVFIYPDRSGIWRGSGQGNGDREEGNAWLIEVDAQEVEKLARHIKRYKLRAKFVVRVLDPEELGVWSLWRDGAGDGKEGGPAWTAHTLGGDSEMGAGRAGEGQGEITCQDQRAPGMGQRLLLPGNISPSSSHTLSSLASDATKTTELQYRIHRYLKGVPEGQGEILREAALPQESNIDFMGGIDYRKGCYVGQELTIRTHHTGVVRKRILPLVVYGVGKGEPEKLEVKEFEGEEQGIEGKGKVKAEEIPREASIGRWEKRGRSAGKWLAGVRNLGLGLCRLEIMVDAGLRERVEGEGAGWKEGDEFKVEWGEGEAEGGEKNVVKVKAFVPSWHLTK